MRSFKLPLVLLAVVVLSSMGAPRAAPRVKKVDLFVVSEKTFVPGSTAAIRVMTRAVRSMSESSPLQGADVTISLGGNGKQQQQLFAGRSDGKGAVEASFKLPWWPVGSYQMSVRVQSQSGEGKLEQNVELRRNGRILLVTDKPIYQPRQVIHLRALALSSHDLRPLGKEMIRLEVADPKGNKVFRRELKADSFGIVSTTFQLADEINLGNYQVEASAVAKDLAEPAAKTVVVKKYVLPKFKVAVESDRSFYLPKQVVKGKIRSDYFFGKPVSGGKVQVEASTFDGTSFQKFSTLKGQTGKDGAWSFELTLPDYFVGQPLMKGDALVKLEVKVTDTASHSETGIRSVPVSATPIRVTAMPDGGQLVPDLENQLFVVATYPDGSPAQASVTVKAGGKQIGALQTDSSGVGAFSFTPHAKEMRSGEYKQVTRFGQPSWAYAKALDLSFSVKDAQGNTATIDKTFSTDPNQEELLVRTDKAIYRSGEVLEATLLATGGGPDTLFVDVVKNRQTVLTRVVPIKKGRGTLRMPLGADLFGSLELHAYRISETGEMVRDARVLYVQPASELSIEASPDQKVYRPGGKAVIRFRVTDAQGRPQAAALGVVIVDEAVYALQEIQPGLEKVYFTLEKELSSPKYQIEFAPQDSLQDMIKVKQIEQKRQRIAKVLLAGARPAAAPGLWENPVVARMQQAQQSYYGLRSALYNAVHHPELKLVTRTANGRWAWAPDVLKKLKAKGLLSEQYLKDPLGETYTMRGIEKLWPDLGAQSLIGTQELSRLSSLRYQVQYELNRRTSNFTKLGGRSLAALVQAAFQAVVKRSPGAYKDPLGREYTWGRVAGLPGFRPEDFALEVDAGRVQQIYYALSSLANRSTQAGGDKRVRLDEKRNAYLLPTGAIKDAQRRGLIGVAYTRDIFGRSFVLRARTTARPGYYYDQRLRFYDVVSAGEDGRLGSEDDLVYPRADQQNFYQKLARALGIVQPQQQWGGLGLRGVGRGGGGGFGALGAVRRARMMDREEAAERAPMAKAAAAPMATAAGQAMDDLKATGKDKGGARDQAGTPVKREVRVREYFPETLLFTPALITDAQGQAKLELSMADSITTWRMTASASSQQGSLGSTSSGIKVFQDFFVDLDLPVSLTQNDEVSVPVVVYNYLKQTQRVRLELKAEPWFELRSNRVVEVQLAPSEVGATFYRMRVKDLGRRMLEVRADGSQMSDAIKRELEILPDGQERNLVSNGRLEGTVSKTVQIPQESVPGASKILVRLYPGVFSQVIEGMQSMLRLPGG